MARASPREPMPAVSNSSTTASGVTMPRGLRAIWVATVPAATSRGVADPAVDVDRFITTNQASWSRLEQLTGAGRRRGARLRPAEVDELVQLYQRASTHLSHARTQQADPALVARLTRLVAASGGVLYGTREPLAVRPRPLLHHELPGRGVARAAASSRCRAALLLVPAVLVGVWLAQSDKALEASAPGGAPRGVRGGGLRGVLLVVAGGRVRHRRSP